MKFRQARIPVIAALLLTGALAAPAQTANPPSLEERLATRAEIPVVVRELFRALQPAGYGHLALEVSPPTAAELDRLARSTDARERLAAHFRTYPPGVPFFTRTRTADPELMRIVHGFDALLILTGSRPSQPL